MRNKIVDRLVSVKSIVTLLLTMTFIVLAFKQIITGDKYYDIFLMVMSFYFGTQSSKEKKPEGDKNE